MTRLTLALLLATTLAFCAACGGSNANTKADAPDELRAYGHLLGESRSAVDGQANSTGAADADGWVPYAGGLKVKFAGDNAERVNQPVPADMNCTEAAKWAGFKDARAPILRDHRCIWPKDDVVHALGPGVAGTLDLKARVLEVRVVQ